MARFLFSRTDNHKIARDGLTGRAAAVLRRAWDPISVVADGISHGLRIERTVFRNTGSFIVGDPGPTRNRWRHPQSNSRMSVNPRFFIIEVPTMTMDSNAVAVMMMGVPGDVDGAPVQRSRRRLQPSNFTQAALDDLRLTHRARFSPAQFGTLVTNR